MSKHEQFRYEIKIYYELKDKEVDIESANLIYDGEEKNIVGIRCTTLKAAVATKQALIRTLKHPAGGKKIKLSELEKIVFKASLKKRIVGFLKEGNHENIDAWMDEFIEEELIEIVPRTEIMSEYDSLWDEYKYRHNLIWKLIYGVIIATTTVIVIPYTEAKIVNTLDPKAYDILLFLPLVVVITAWFAILREIDLLDRVKNIFCAYQKLSFPVIPTKKEYSRWVFSKKIYRKIMSVFNFRMRVIVLLLVLLITAAIHIRWGFPTNEQKNNNVSSTAVSRSTTEELGKIRAILEKGLSANEQSQANASQPVENQTTDTTFKTGIGLTIVGALIFASIIFKRSHSTKRMIIATLLSGGVTILSGLSLINLETFSLLKIERQASGVNERSEPKGTSINIDNLSLEWPFEAVHLDDDLNESILFEAFEEIGPFEPGQEVLAHSSKVMGLIKEVKARASNQHELIFMIIAGKVDKRLLRKPLQEKYGSNFALAQRRAIWVKKALVDAEIPGLDYGKLITIATGPEFFPKKGDDDSLEIDRIVRCYALWIKKNSKGGN